MRWTEHVACRKKRNAYSVLLGKPEGDHLEDQGIDGRLIGVLKWMLKKQEGREGTGFIWLMIGTNGRLL
jgi:hypothetical protein